MNPEKLLVLKVLDGDADHRKECFKRLNERGIDSSYFMVNSDYWSFIVEHKKKYKDLPTRGTFETKFGMTDKLEVKEPLEFYMDSIAEYKRYRIVAAAMDKADGFFENGLIDQGIAYIRGEIKKVDTTFNLKDHFMNRSVDERVAQYEFRINNPGIDGIPSGFNRLDSATYGWHAGEFILMSAFLGNYKTWTLLYMVKAAMMAGFRPMIATVEMGQMQVARRLDSILSGTEFEKLRSGSFTGIQEIDDFKKRMDTLKGMPDCIVIGGVSFTDLFLQAKVEEHSPDILFIDGIYLMEDGSGKNRAQWEQLNAISRSLKILAENYRIPVIATTQGWKASNKPGSEGKETVDDIAFSGGMAQNADIAVSLGRIYDPIAEAFTNRIWMKLTKLREGEPVKFQAAIDFIKMEMGEIAGVTDHRTSYKIDAKIEDDTLVEGVHYNVGDREEIDDDEEIPF